ncbi:MAG: alpha/beta hydrolase [Fimbriimonas sp.]
MMTAILLGGLLASFAAIDAGRPMYDLWPKGNPGGWTRPDAEKSEKEKNAGFLIVSQISHATLEFFPAKNAKPNAPTVLICPGGGYYVVAIEHEGWEIATRLNEAGINAAVLKYRIPVPDRDKVRHLVPLQDAQRAIRLLRSDAAKLKIDPARIGILGFSAGGHLAAVTSTSSADAYPATDDIDKLSAHPAFTLLIYAAYLNVDGEVKLQPEVAVSAKTPPAFIIQTEDDFVPVEGGMAYALACKKAEVPVELHLFPKGGHGYGLRSKEAGIMSWPERAIEWINRLYK